MILVDTSVLVAALRGVRMPQTDRLARQVARGQVLLGDLVICEVLRGAEDEGEAMRIRERMGVFRRVEVGGERIAELAALHYRVLRTRGFTIRSTVDLMLGAFCIVNGHRLLHNDRDFVPMAEHLGLLEA